MIQIHPAESRFSGNIGWLQFNFSFSFADYYDPNNMNFGPLRVFNEDYIQPGKGFGTHPHRDMEIVSVVISGELAHEDNTGGKEVLRVGEVQRMTAGTGILHSEINSSETETANIMQLWFLPEEKGLTPSYEQKTFDQEAMRNGLLPIVSKRIQGDRIATIHQDLTIYLSRLEAGNNVTFKQDPARKIYLFVYGGSVTLNGEHALNRSDAARITDLSELAIASPDGAQFMLIDLP
ncbi:pirin family protein [Paenibacillus montanisoli]|uniref:Pirin family protein n=1 Tax=Paenibacillus montanisoli TaxID=2081970 RepID=A0A328TVV5_9BACL|nr:pirin family protein [Paenibacillus montanisoli]RAP74629.1 pirin family protein [Paenibacillus montanisoli]